MLRKIFLLGLAIIFISANLTAQKTTPPLAANPKYSLGIMTGYTGGFGINVSGTISEFSYDIPLAVRFSGGYNIREAGNPLDARKVFINDNTNGDPAESAHSFDLRLDFAYPINLFSIRKSLLYVGPRYSMHTSTFEFVGGNEFGMTSKSIFNPLFAIYLIWNSVLTICPPSTDLYNSISVSEIKRVRDVLNAWWFENASR